MSRALSVDSILSLVLFCWLCTCQGLRGDDTVHRQALQKFHRNHPNSRSASLDLRQAIYNSIQRVRTEAALRAEAAVRVDATVMAEAAVRAEAEVNVGGGSCGQR